MTFCKINTRTPYTQNTHTIFVEKHRALLRMRFKHRFRSRNCDKKKHTIITILHQISFFVWNLRSKFDDHNFFFAGLIEKKEEIEKKVKTHHYADRKKSHSFYYFIV